jgi:hypothetical protein
MYTQRPHLFWVFAAWLFVLGLTGCGGEQRRKEGIGELKNSQTPVHGLHILVSAGVTKAEYSQRLEDVLLQEGDLNDSEQRTVPKFGKRDEDTVKEIYSHISTSVEAYKSARNFFGDDFDAPGCDDGCMTLAQQTYDAEKANFPTLAQLQPVKVYQQLDPNAPPEYFRNDMLQALWKVADDEDDSAKTLIEKLGAQ